MSGLVFRQGGFFVEFCFWALLPHHWTIAHVTHIHTLELHSRYAPEGGAVEACGKSPRCETPRNYTICYARSPPERNADEKFDREFKETGEKCGEILTKFSVDFRPSISREIGRKNFTQIPPHIRTSNSTRLNQNSFTAILWELVGPKSGPKILMTSILQPRPMWQGCT